MSSQKKKSGAVSKRDLQEALARRHEAEEKRERELEEKMREEEERLRVEEECRRKAEEVKLEKKEKKKHKQEAGLLLTPKQKEDECKRELIRKQLLAGCDGGFKVSDVGSKDAGLKKRPVYGTKKSKKQEQHSGVAGAQESVAQESVAVDCEQRQQQQYSGVAGAQESVAQCTSAVDCEQRQQQQHSGVAGLQESVASQTDGGYCDSGADWESQHFGITGAQKSAALLTDGEQCTSGADSQQHSGVAGMQKGVASLADGGQCTSGADSLQHQQNSGVAGMQRVVASVADGGQCTSGADCEQQQHYSGVAGVQKGIPSLTDGNQSTVAAADCKQEHFEVGFAGKISSLESKSEENLRSPICCIMGHVDAGKTKVLDCIRGTNVQEGEAGGITQQIGATYFPTSNIRERTKCLKEDAKLIVPGLLVIDTPGHECFSNLRFRGSGLCDIAILVVDIMHGLEPQTIESLNLLKARGTKFIVALNKVDRLYGWKQCANSPIQKTLEKQKKNVMIQYETKVRDVIGQFHEQGLNSELYYKIKSKRRDMEDTISIVPTSAVTGEGIPDFLLLLVQWAQRTMVDRLTFSTKVECSVLEVKVVEGHGTTIDVILVNGVLHEGDQIVCCSMNGDPIVTTIRALLTPHPMKELRVKGSYHRHKEIKAAQGIKIAAQGLENAVPGTGLYVVRPEDDIDEVKKLASEDISSIISKIDKKKEGVYVQASTLGSLEALVAFLKSPDVNIPIHNINIGPVHKKDVMKAGTMLEKNKKEYATILAFDVEVTQEARKYADVVGVKIFTADVIYHLFDQFKAYIDNIKLERKIEASVDAVFPCVLKIVRIFKNDPLLLGVDVLKGTVKVGTPLCIHHASPVSIGRIASIQSNHKQVDCANKGQQVAVMIVGDNTLQSEQPKNVYKHLKENDELISYISRKSIDVLKDHYWNDGSLTTEDKQLLLNLKKILRIY